MATNLCMTKCCAKDEIYVSLCNARQPKYNIRPNIVLADLVFLQFIIPHWYVYKDIQGGVELSPLRNLRKLRKSKMAAISQDQTKNSFHFYHTSS